MATRQVSDPHNTPKTRFDPNVAGAWFVEDFIKVVVVLTSLPQKLSVRPSNMLRF